MQQPPLPIFIFLAALLLTIPPAYAPKSSWTSSSPGSTIGGVTVSSDGSAISVGQKRYGCSKKKSGELLAKEPFGEQVFFTTDGVHLLSSYGSSLIIFSR